MIKTQKAINTFSGGIDQDTSVNKYDNTHYFDAENMRIISNDELNTASISSVKGTLLKLSFASGDNIVGFCKIRNNYNDPDKDSIVFFTYNANAPTSRIYLFEGDPYTTTGTLNLNQAFPVITGSSKYGYIYRNSDLNFSTSYPIKAEGRYESTNVRKIYWTDNYNNIRYMILDTITGSEPVTIFEVNPAATLKQPTVVIDSGGSYNSGMVQYSYQLYVKYGARTTFSPCSPMITLSGGDSSANSSSNNGTALGENTGKSCVVTIPNIDTTFDRVRIVAVYYTEFNVNPVINIVGELEYESTATNITFIDTGSNIYGTVPLEEFRLTGQFDYKADSLAAKNNYLFYGNTSKIKWNPDWLNPNSADFWDARAIRYRNYIEDTTSPVTYTHDGVNTVLARNGGVDNELLVTINGFSTLPFVPVGATVLNVSNVVCSGIAGTAVTGTYDNGGGPSSANFSATIAELDTPPIKSISYNSGTDVLTFVFDKTINFFTGYVSLTGGSILGISFTYTATGASIGEAIVNDLISGDLTINQPAGNTPAQWNTAGWTNYVYNHDGINNFNDIDNDGDVEYEFKYQYDCATLGASGKNIKVEFIEEDLKLDENATEEKSYLNAPFDTTVAGTTNKSSLRDEVYRLYIVFFNTKMQFSNPQWVCDLRMPSVSESSFLDENTEIYATYLYPKITLYNLPADTDLLGWQVFRCERKSTDKSILMRGLISNILFDGATYSRIYSSNTSPYSFIRAEDYGGLAEETDIVEFIAPEITFNKDIKRVAGDILKIDGRYSAVDVGSVAGSGVNYYSYYFKTKEVTGVSTTDTLSYGVDEMVTISTSSSDNENLLYTQIKGAQVENRLWHTVGGTDYASKMGTTMLLGVDAAITVDAATTGHLLGSYMRNIHSSRYGGITYEARSYNQVIPYSEFTLIADTDAICHYGDTFIHFYTFVRGMLYTKAYDERFENIINVAVETSINLFKRLDPIQNYIYPRFGSTYSTYGIMERVIDGVDSFPEKYPIELGDLYRQNKVYSQDGNATLIQCTVFDSNNIESMDNEIVASGLKINNEYFDNWTNLYTNNTIWLDPKYGPIRNIFVLNNTLYAGQDKAIAQISVQERSMIQDNSQRSLVLGTGGVLERYDYLTTTSGFQNYYDMISTEKSFYFVDRRNKLIYMLTNEGTVPISEVAGYRSYMKKFGNITTVKTGYDPIYKEVLFYISDGSISQTSVLNEYMSTFTGRYTFTPSLMFNLNDQFYSITSSSCYHHNEGNYGHFYGVYSPSTVTAIINPNGNIVNRYDIVDTRVDIYSGATAYRTEQFNSLIASNNYQSITKTLTYDDTAKTITGQWRTWLIPDDLSAEAYRLTDTYLRLKLSRTNTSANKKIVLHDIITYYRPIRN